MKPEVVTLSKDPEILEHDYIALQWGDGIGILANPSYISHKGWMELSQAKAGDEVELQRNERSAVIIGATIRKRS
jgi:hypothetical protein